jgi:hypothetical protein
MNAIKDNIKGIYPHLTDLVGRYKGVEDKHGDYYPEGVTLLGNVGYFDGNTYVSINSTCGLDNIDINTSNSIDFEIYMTLDNTKIGSPFQSSLDTLGNGSNNTTYIVSHDNGSIYWALGGVGGSFNKGVFADGNVHKINIKKVGTNVIFYIDDIQQQSISGTPQATTNQVYTLIGKYKYGIFKGILYGLKLTVDGNLYFKYDINHQWGSKIYDKSVFGNHGTIIGSTLPTFWGKYQDNIKSEFDGKGYTLYRHNTDSVTNKDIVIPLINKTNVEIVDTIANYTKVDIFRGRFKYDIQKVNSNCIVGDGVCYAEGNSDILHNGTYLPFKIIFKFVGSGTMSLGGKAYADATELMIRLISNKLYFRVSDDGIYATAPLWIPSDILTENAWHELEGSINNGILTGSITEYGTDNQGKNYVVTSRVLSHDFGISNVYISSSNIQIMRRISAENLVGSIAYFKYGNAEYKCSQGNPSTMLINSGTAGGNATIVGATYPDVWGLQSVYHPNHDLGFSECFDVASTYYPSTNTSKWTMRTGYFSELYSTARFLLMSTTVSLSNGYGLYFRNDGRLDLEKFTSDSLSYLGTVSNIDYSIKHDIVMTRSEAGNIIVTLDGIELFNVIDTTHTTSNYIVSRFYTSPPKFEYIKDENDDRYNNLGYYKIPSSTQNPLLDVLGFPLTNPSGDFNNGSETEYQISELLNYIHKDYPFSSLTKNKNLEWDGAIIRNFSKQSSVTSIITQETNGTRINRPDIYSCYIIQVGKLKTNTNYRYLMELEEIVGSSLLYLGSNYVIHTTVGVKTGILNSGAGANINLQALTSNCNFVVSKFYVWEEGSIPPIPYSELKKYNQCNFFCDTSVENQTKNITIYDKPLNDIDSLPLKKYLNQGD